MNYPPRYEHKCPDCQYKGRWDKYDIYVCNRSILMRDGDTPPEYLSYPLEVVLERMLHLRSDSMLLTPKDTE